MLIASAIAGLVLFGVVTWHSFRYSEVVVTLVSGASEPRDPALPIVGGKSALPDYNVELRVHDRWLDCGTHQDRLIGSGLRFPVVELAPVHATAELRLREVDGLVHDLLEQVPVTGSPLQGNAYRFELVRTFDFMAGLDWLVDTRAVQLLIGLIGLVILLSILSALLH